MPTQAVLFPNYPFKSTVAGIRGKSLVYPRITSYFSKLLSKKTLSCPSQLSDFALSDDFHVLFLICHMILNFPVVNNSFFESMLYQHACDFS